MSIDPKEIELGTKHEHEHTQDDALARKIAMDHLKDDPHYYTKLKKAGLEQEGALTPTERGMEECDAMDAVAGMVQTIAPSIPVVKISVPSATLGGGQAKLTSSGLGQSGTPKPLKSDNLDAPSEKAKVGANKIVMSKTPNIAGKADPLNHFGSQIMGKC